MDSLQKVLLTAKPDTGRVNALWLLARDYDFLFEFSKTDSLANAALALADTLHYKRGMAYAYTILGLSCQDRGVYATALEYEFKALAICETINEPKDLGEIYNLIGVLYDDEGDYPKALEYHNKALDIRRKINDKEGVAASLNNIACVYGDKGDMNKVVDYFTQTLKQFEEMGDKSGIGTSYNNLGGAYGFMGNYAKSEEELKKALAIQLEIEDWSGLARTYDNLGDISLKQGRYKEAVDYENKSLEIAHRIHSLEVVKEAEEPLSLAYEKLGDGMKALEHYKLYIQARDSLTNKENTRKSVQAEMTFEFEKKQATAKADQDKKDVVQKEQAHKQQLVIYFISGILLLVFAFAVFAYRSYMQKQKANKELDNRNHKLESAYHVIEEKNREITDSINYARRIQQAILPSVEEIKKALPNSFVLYKPKDIVSGDFYFFHTAPSHPSPPGKENNKQVSPNGGDLEGAIFLAAADCTGHGVPGAFMSMIGSEKLRDAVQQHSDTGKILNAVNKGIIMSLRQSGEQSSTRDGMDIALVSLAPINAPQGGALLSGVPPLEGYREAALLQFSGAYRPLYVIRKNSNEIEEIKATKKAIGGFTEDDTSFDANEVMLHEGDIFYIFSDGYADQFGGKEGKKLTTKRFKELLLSIKNKPMHEQEKALDGFIEEWKTGREQLDDILVIGVRV